MRTDKTPLYPRLLGVAWAEAHEAVRQAHLHGDELRQVGEFCVEHGSSKLARLLCWMLRMPPEGDRVTVHLTIARVESGERWTRHFGSRVLVSKQKAGPGGVMIEHIRWADLRFCVEVSDGAIARPLFRKRKKGSE